MAPRIGVNLRVTGYCNQGGRKYMEDAFAVAYQQTDDEQELEYAYFGIFDGHGGREAALFAKEHLMNFIVAQKNFWSDKDENVLKAIKEGFVATHMAMWKEVGKWPQTVSGLPSTSGTTASVVFIRKGKMYVGHVGDSAIVLGYKEPDCKHYSAQPLTDDHKPESPSERKRIEDVGGSVMSKCGVQRVVWNRPRIGHKGPIRRSTHIDQIPFLAVARSLGDLWSYDYFHGQFIVSPEPDVSVVTIDPKRDRCIILATDGVWNMISPKEAVRIVEASETENEHHFLNDDTHHHVGNKPWMNPSRILVDRALSLWVVRKKRADNTSVVTVMLDPPGPPRSEVLLRKKILQKLRPRDESEARPSGESDWRSEPRSSTILMSHAPSSHAMMMSSEESAPSMMMHPGGFQDTRYCNNHPSWGAARTSSSSSAFLAPNYGGGGGSWQSSDYRPPLPPKTRMPVRTRLPPDPKMGEHRCALEKHYRQHDQGHFAAVRVPDSCPSDAAARSSRRSAPSPSSASCCHQRGSSPNWTPPPVQNVAYFSPSSSSSASSSSSSSCDALARLACTPPLPPQDSSGMKATCPGYQEQQSQLSSSSSSTHIPKPVPLHRAPRNWAHQQHQQQQNSENGAAALKPESGKRLPDATGPEVPKSEGAQQQQQHPRIQHDEQQHVMTAEKTTTSGDSQPKATLRLPEDNSLAGALRMAAAAAAATAPLSTTTPLSNTRTMDSKEEAGDHATRLKRKSPPGSREMFALATKQSRFSTTTLGQQGWGACGLAASGESQHLTRSRDRLRKAQA